VDTILNKSLLYHFDQTNVIVFQIEEQVPDSDVIIRKLDLASLTSVRQCAKEINETEERLDILINNAGITMAVLLINITKNTREQGTTRDPFAIRVRVAYMSSVIA